MPQNYLNRIKKLWSDLGTGDLIQVSAAMSEEAEAESVIMKLQPQSIAKRRKGIDVSNRERVLAERNLIEQPAGDVKSIAEDMPQPEGKTTAEDGKG